MSVKEFSKSLEVGKIAENHFISLMNKKNKEIVDVRDDPEYRDIDVDFIVDGKTYEIKNNYIDARYGRKGRFFWVELSVGDNKGFYYKSKADYFVFLNNEGRGMQIENNSDFREYIDGLIQNGDHTPYGNNRIDKIKDKRYGGYIIVENMRCYTEDLRNTKVNFGIIRKS